MVQPLLDKKRKGELLVQPGRRPNMQPDYKKNISHPACIQDGVVGTKREKMEKKQRKRYVTIAQSVKSSFVKNVLKVFTQGVRSENH